MDADDVTDDVDNCPNDANAEQSNGDGAALLTLSLPADHTLPNADMFGDACDSDDDNDFLLDADELSETACTPFALGTTSHPYPTNLDSTNDDDLDGNPAPPMGSDIDDDGPSWDTDNDGVLDGIECQLGTDPRNPASRPSDSMCGGSLDLDLDGLRAGAERCKWGTSDSQIDTD